MHLKNTQFVDIPDGIEITLNGVEVTVKGPRGQLTRKFDMVPLDIQKIGKQLHITCWFPRAQLNAMPNTIASHIKNMITGVTRGFMFTMKAAHAHFPMEFNVKGNTIEVRNFIGQKEVKVIHTQPGVEVHYEKEKKNEIKISGSDLEAVSRTCADIHRSCKVHNKDIRKFLDGIYVFERGFCQ